MKDIKKLQAKIKHYKNKLRKEALKNGLYENFGQKEVRQLNDWIGTDGYQDSRLFTALKDFEDWAKNYTPYEGKK